MGDKAYGYFKGGAASLKDQTESAFGLNKNKTEVQEELVAPITVSDLDSRPLSLLDARDDDKYLGESDGGHMFIDRLGKTYTIFGTSKPEDNRTGAERWKENLEPVVEAAKEWWEEGAELPSIRQIYGVGKSVAEGVYDTVSKISGAATGKVSGDDITLADTFDATAGMGVGSSLVKVPEGSLRIFGGLSAKNAPDVDRITNSFNSEFEVFKQKVLSDEIDLDFDMLQKIKKLDPESPEIPKVALKSPEYNFYNDTAQVAQSNAISLMVEHPKYFKKTLKSLDNSGEYFRGRDGMLRFEIDDSKLNIKNRDITVVGEDPSYDVEDFVSEKLRYYNLSPEAKIKFENANPGYKIEKTWTSLDEVIEHPVLFEQYPNLKNVAVITDREFFNNPKYEEVLGYFEPNYGYIAMNPNLSDDVWKSTILHEMQHVIQRAENFDSGTSDETDAVSVLVKIASESDKGKQVWRDYRKALKQYKKDLNKYNDLPILKRIIAKKPTEPIEPKKYFDPLGFKPLEEKEHIIYELNSGEVEARNVTDRMNLSARQRKILPPEKTQDSQYGDQWTNLEAKKEMKDEYNPSYSKSFNSPKLEDFGFKTDNPGGDWLESKLRFAERSKADASPNTYRANLGNSDGVTGYFQRPLNINPEVFKDVKGAMGEESFRPDPTKLKNLKKDIAEEGYDKLRGTILIHVREDGEPFIVEGNHRIIEAIESGRSTIPVEIKYLRGAEEVQGDFSPEEIIKYADKKVNDNE